MTRFQIFRIAPIYCPITDGLIGSRTVPLPMTYVHEVLAQKLAARLNQEDYEAGGDDSFVTAPVGQGPRSWRGPAFDEVSPW